MCVSLTVTYSTSPPCFPWPWCRWHTVVLNIKHKYLLLLGRFTDVFCLSCRWLIPDMPTHLHCVQRAVAHDNIHTNIISGLVLLHVKLQATKTIRHTICVKTGDVTDGLHQVGERDNYWSLGNRYILSHVLSKMHCRLLWGHLGTSLMINVVCVLLRLLICSLLLCHIMTKIVMGCFYVTRVR